ncbi:MAG: glycine zipper 2TM domain-containing protein [Sphingopyxis sp.]|nr:glycine zipper 2TM domain-containing protein [Sphingopyxis sp.]
MRTILLLGMAAGSLLLAGRAGAEVPMIDAQREAKLSASAAFGHDPRPSLDYGNPDDPDARVYTGYPDRVPSEVEYRRVSGYDAEGRWTGTWNGTYEAPDGRRYDGSYEGSVEGHGAAYPAPPAYDPYYGGGYDARHDADMTRRCGRGGAVSGAVVGGIVGGVAGNRIAGHGDRTAGTLIGGTVGAVAGSAIGNAADKRTCEQWTANRSRHHGGASSTTYQYGGYDSGYGYGYYTPGVVVTTTIINGAPVVTETVETSTRTYYENVPVRKRHVAKKRWKPKAAPRCGC